MTDKIRYRTWQHPTLKHWNGYVGISKEHPLYGIGYSESFCGHPGCSDHTPEAKLDVHGGLTYSGKPQSSEWDSTLWWFGFDTGHSFDDPRYGGTVKGKVYVIKECKRLAKQLQDWKGAKP